MLYIPSVEPWIDNVTIISDFHSRNTFDFYTRIVLEEDERQTRELAYKKWEQAGRPNGRDIEFWTLAEKERTENWHRPLSRI